jgi:hypothetical protein
VAGPDLAHWLTKPAAAEAIGVSTKTVEQLATDGQLETALWRRPGGGARIRVYNPDDVARVATARRTEAPAFVLPDGTALAPAIAPTNGHGTLAPAPAGSALETLAQAVLTAALRTVGGSENLLRSGPTSEKLFVDLAEAAVITGLPVPALRRRLKVRAIDVIRSDRLYVRRRDLEGL